MGLFDVVLLIIIGGFGLFGLWFGFFHTLGSLLGTIAGVFLASRYYEPVAGWLVEITGWGENTSSVIIFTLSFVLINRLVGLLFYFVDRMLGVITRLPFVSSVNRVAGLAFGIFEGLVTIGFVVYFASQFPISDRVTNAIHDSAVTPRTLPVIEYLLPLLPEGLQAVKDGFGYVEAQVLK